MNTPTLETERLILRKFTENDMQALYLILSDEEVNKFLPWIPVKNLEETEKFYKERYLSQYELEEAYAYAVCLKTDNIPIGYVGVDMDGGHDLGYGLRKGFWNQGIITEAVKAVLKQLENDGFPFVTATHDRNNPASGRVMQKAGMIYRYSYEEQWMPKNFPVIFRMYQYNFTIPGDFVYMEYWNKYETHMIEEIVPQLRFMWTARIIENGKVINERYFYSREDRENFVKDNPPWVRRGKICRRFLTKHLSQNPK